MTIDRYGAWHAGAPEPPPSLEKRSAVALEEIAKHLNSIASDASWITVWTFLTMVGVWFI